MLLLKFKDLRLVFLFLFPLAGLAQQNGSVIVSQQDLVARALNNSANARAALLSVKQQKQLLNSTFNLPNPEVFIESPTGVFYTGSVTQSLDFPTVYKKQYQLQEQQVGLAEKQRELTDARLRYQVKVLYLNAQYQDSARRQLYIQDTIYQKLSSSAIRLFDAGQIDFLQKTFAETQYGEIHNQYEQANLNYKASIARLKYIAGISGDFSLMPLTSTSINYSAYPDTTLLRENTEYRVSRQNEAISQKNLELQRNKALPGLAFGYFNQGERSTPTYLRFRFGITVPLWFWQYKGNISAARTDLEVSQKKSEGLKQELNVQLMQAISELASYNQALSYYQTSGLSKSAQIISAAKRFLQSGQTDYATFLRTVNDAYAIQARYLEAIKNANQSILTIDFLTGQQ